MIPKWFHDQTSLDHLNFGLVCNYGRNHNIVSKYTVTRGKCCVKVKVKPCTSYFFTFSYFFQVPDCNVNCWRERTVFQLFLFLVQVFKIRNRQIIWRKIIWWEMAFFLVDLEFREKAKYYLTSREILFVFFFLVRFLLFLELHIRNELH